MGYNMTAVLNVLVIGHSHIYWLGKFADASDLFANFRETCVQMQRDIGIGTSRYPGVVLVSLLAP